MAGSRPSGFKRGGGFLNNVDGVITGYEFTDEFNGTPFKPGIDPKTKKERFHALYARLSVRVDGADEDTTTTLFAGGADDFEIEDDGHTLVPVDGTSTLGANTGFGKLITSLVEAGFPENNLPEDQINYEAVIGTRVRFEQRTDEETTKRLGKRKGKDGKEYNRQDLVITSVYALPGTSKAAGKTSAAKGKTKAAEFDAEAKAAETLVDLLSAAPGNVLPKARIKMKAMSALMASGLDAKDREAVCKIIHSDEFLGTEAGWSYDAKKQVAELADESEAVA